MTERILTSFAPGLEGRGERRILDEEIEEKRRAVCVVSLCGLRINSAVLPAPDEVLEVDRSSVEIEKR
jgi:hypothetical protein